MKRMISPRRIAGLLRAEGFALSSDVGSSDIIYARQSALPELWEQIVVVVGGKRGEGVAADVGVSVLYSGARYGGLGERRAVRETGTPGGPPPEPPPGHRILRDAADALAWEQMVARICPDEARAISGNFGIEILERTAEARAAVSKYLDLFGDHEWHELRERFQSRATAREVREAERVAGEPGVVNVYNGHEFYKTIILGIVLYSDRVEGRQIVRRGVEVWPAFDPWSKKEPDWSKWQLAWRIEILADRMLARYPETMPNRLPDG